MENTKQIGFVRHASGLYFHEETFPEVMDAISSLRASGARCRLFFGDRATGVTWKESYDVTGHIGSSMGPCKAPLLIANSRSMGGGAILTHCIVGIMTAPGKFIYRHPSFDNGQWSVKNEVFTDDVEKRFYAAASYRDGELIGRHFTEAAAKRFADFMSGKRMSR